MIGFAVSSGLATQILDGISEAQTSRGLPVYWTTGSYPILSGPYEGSVFIPASDALLATPLRSCPQNTPSDFPEADQLLLLLGGLEARVDVAPEDIVPPEDL